MNRTISRPTCPAGRARLTMTALAAAAALSACGPDQPAAIADVHGGESRTRNGEVLNGTDISAVINRPDLILQDTTGAPFDLTKRPSDELTVLFFGYTNCPDVCPTTMADLAAARRALASSDRARIQVVFVTEDPQHDTPDRLRIWLARFDPDFVGLVGGGGRTAPAIAALKSTATEITNGTSSETGVPHSPTEPAHAGQHQTGSGRNVAHGGSVYAFLGDQALVYTGGTTPEQFAADFRNLLAR